MSVRFPSHSHSYCQSEKADQTSRHDTLFSALKTTDHLVWTSTVGQGSKTLFFSNPFLSFRLFYRPEKSVKICTTPRKSGMRLSSWQPWDSSPFTGVPRREPLSEPWYHCCFWVLNRQPGLSEKDKCTSGIRLTPKHTVYVSRSL